MLYATHAAGSTRTLLYSATAQGFGVIASAFLTASIEKMIPWLIAIGALVFCDLCSAIRRCLLTGEKIKFSGGGRQTLAKSLTYFSAVVAACLINNAECPDRPIRLYVCFGICILEGASIFDNLLKPKGIEIDWWALVTFVIRWLLRMDTSGLAIIKRTDIHKPDNNNDKEGHIDEDSKE